MSFIKPTFVGNFNDLDASIVDITVVYDSRHRDDK